LGSGMRARLRAGHEFFMMPRNCARHSAHGKKFAGIHPLTQGTLFFMNAEVADTHYTAFDLKGSMLTVMVLRLKITDTDLIACRLREKVTQAPGMFQQSPLVLDLQDVERKRPALDVKQLLVDLRKHGFAPIGLRGGNARHRREAQESGLKLLPPAQAKPERAEKAVSVVAAPAQVVSTPVRSGQQIMSKNSDLVILSTVSAGAEILASGSIHVYGTLRGRALAGINGDTQARIFCNGLHAELVAVAGQYQISEDFEDALLGKPVQVYLDGEQLVIAPFGMAAI